MHPPRFVVALTGGIAAGKSVVTARFAALGVGVHDADVAAREVVAPGTPALAEIVAHFGAGALQADGQLDRPAMRARVFADAGARAALETIIHPRVRAWLHARVAADHGTYCIVAIPLLVENRDHYAWVDRVLVVDAPETVQIARLRRRDGIDRAHAARMLAAQSSRAQRRVLADDVLVNDGDAASLDAQVAALHARYLTLAAGSAPR